MKSKNLISLLFLIIIMVQHTLSSEFKNELGDKYDREKRGAIFRRNSATGILIAIAVPLDLPTRNVFMSYNFEANYNMPTISQDIAPGIWQRLDLPGVKPAEEGRSAFLNDTNNTEFHKMKRNIDSGRRGSLLSRTKIYKMFESKMNAAGFNGTECLLRAICDNAAISVNTANGILGDVIHIILSPSTSMDERLNRLFYDAETNGRQTKRNCDYIYKFCPASVFDRLNKIL